MGVSDPHVRVFNDTIYLYSGHDATTADTTWVMKDWRVFSTTDLVNWNLRNTISPKENYIDDNSKDCWASDAASRNGKYYFYFSDRKRGVGVMTSDAPAGPFKDALGKPLVSPMHDPTILTDDDTKKTPYLIYGDRKPSESKPASPLTNSPSVSISASSRIANTSSACTSMSYRSLWLPATGSDMASGSPCLSAR